MTCEIFKKIPLLLLMCALLLGCQEHPTPLEESATELNSNSKTVSSTKTEKSLTLKKAIEIAQEEALKWNKEAKLYYGLSVDNDKEQTGIDGKRKYWNFKFGIPDRTDLYLITIHNGLVYTKDHFPDELDKMSVRYFIDTEQISFDTPELLKKGKEITNLYPGDVFAKGYNFGISKDPQKNIPLVMVIGWDKPRQSMIYLMFNATTGELFNKFEREQYNN